MSRSDGPSEQQERVIGLLLSGKNQREGAEKVGVARETVSRWHNEPAFIAMMNARRLELWQAHRDRLCTLAHRAVDAMQGLLDSGDEGVRLRAAMAILKTVSEGGKPVGPTEPEDVEAEQAFVEQMRTLHRMDAEDHRRMAEQRHELNRLIADTS